MEKVEKFLNLYTLLIINLAIILAAETFGAGRFFYESGLIYLISLIFVFLAVFRIFSRYYVQDEFFKKFLRTSLGVFGLLSLVNVFEYLAVHLSLFGNLGMEIEIGVIGFYFLSFFILLISFESALKSYQNLISSFGKENRKISTSLSIFAVILLILLPIFVLKNINILIYVYMFLILSFGILVIFRASQIKKIMSVLKGFINYFLLGIIFVIIASLFKFFEIFGLIFMDKLQVTYISHFLIYFALSFMFVALGRLSNLGGIYQDIKEKIAKGNI